MCLDPVVVGATAGEYRGVGGEGQRRPQEGDWNPLKILKTQGFRWVDTPSRFGIDSRDRQVNNFTSVTLSRQCHRATSQS